MYSHTRQESTRVLGSSAKSASQDVALSSYDIKWRESVTHITEKQSLSESNTETTIARCINLLAIRNVNLHTYKHFRKLSASRWCCSITITIWRVSKVVAYRKYFKQWCTIICSFIYIRNIATHTVYSYSYCNSYCVVPFLVEFILWA